MGRIFRNIKRLVTPLIYSLVPSKGVPPRGVNFEKITFNLKGVERTAGLFIPKGYSSSKEWPLIVYLHGGGERFCDADIRFANHQLIRLAINEYEKEFPAVVLLPLCLGDKVWAHIPAKPIQTNWRLSTFGTESAPNVSDYLTESIQYVLSNYNIDKLRVSLTGHSMGGEGAMRYGAQHSNKISAIAASAGSAVIVPSDAPKLAKMNIWMYQGSDDHISTNALARQNVKAIQDAGGNVIYKELGGVGHEVGENFFLDPNLIDWLVTQRLHSYA
ncbi:alpha/beta hydrolase-fold protein [uncultured Paraglaciecola sp.]|uniref:carboxylesterase family protein n=1 Tax=uncultured Paraglaciecola sp. TaxID=1765024 RepID=UPI0025946DBF|nr:alpha/beta hydrolase-fold protein [uncultured Paraglaciecola sp.]